MPAPTSLAALRNQNGDAAFGQADPLEFVGDCPACQDENSMVRDVAGKRNVCLRCGHAVTDAQIASAVLDRQLAEVLASIKRATPEPVTQCVVAGQCPRCFGEDLVYDAVADANYCQACEWPAYPEMNLAQYRAHLQRQYERWIDGEFARNRAALYGAVEETTASLKAMGPLMQALGVESDERKVA